MALMSRHHIDFVALDLALQHHRRTTADDPFAELLDHRPGVILVDIEFLGDLQSRQVETHEIQASDPGAQGLVMAGEDGIGEVVEASAAAAAFVALAMRLGVIPAVLEDRVRGATRACHAVGPPHVPDRLIALGVVEEVLDVHHRSTPRMRDAEGGRADRRPDRPGRL
jgi:hypothetical protein